MVQFECFDSTWVEIIGEQAMESSLTESFGDSASAGK